MDFADERIQKYKYHVFCPPCNGSGALGYLSQFAEAMPG